MSSSVNLPLVADQPVSPLSSSSSTESQIIPDSEVLASTDRIAFALAPRSRDYYLPFFKSARFGRIEPEWIELPGREAHTWERMLRDINPTILVTGWGTPPIPDWFAKSTDSSLGYICHLAGSVKPIVSRDLIEKGVVVSNWGTLITHTVAEHAMLLLLGALRNIGGWNSYLKQWSFNVTPFACSTLQTRALRGSRVGLHGFGAIAREIAEMLKPFQVSISSYSHGVPRSLFQQHGVKCCSTLEELFSTCNIIIECEALTAQSEGSVTEELLQLLPNDSVFVNVGRAQTVVDDAALVRQAAKGKLRLALDVFHQEPLPEDSPLYQVAHGLYSPHVAGPTQDMFPKLAELAMYNIRQYLKGFEVEGRVSLEMFDRST